MHLIRKGQIRWLPKRDVIGQRQFIHQLLPEAAPRCAFLYLQHIHYFRYTLRL